MRNGTSENPRGRQDLVTLPSWGAAVLRPYTRLDILTMQLIDSHAHIDFPQFAEDREAMLDRARAAGVETILAIGSGPGPEKLDAAIPFAEEHDWIYASIGVHPHEAKLVTPRPFATAHSSWPSTPK